MDLARAGLREQPFRTHGKPLSIVSYASRRAALDALRNALFDDRRGLALLQGPMLSGKSTVVREFLEHIDDDCAVARVDGNGLNTSGLLESMLRQFGYELDYNSANELLGMLRVFTLQQAASHRPPILVVDNTHALNPSALRAVCELAELRVRATYALRIVLVSDRSLAALTAADDMAGIANRVAADFHLQPMTSEETRLYLHEKLRAAGSPAPGFVFPEGICADLWQASGGWPGILDRIALLALSRAETLPVGPAQIEHPALPSDTRQDTVAAAPPEEAPASGPPRLVITCNGKTLRALSFDRPRLLVGRSEHNDIALDSKFVSRHHLLLVRSGDATFLMDLNSTNGSFVNSKRVSNHVLAHEDVISLGQHRIKFSDPNAKDRRELTGAEFADTAIMKTLDDMRRLLAQENTETLPAVPEQQLPGGG